MRKLVTVMLLVSGTLLSNVQANESLYFGIVDNHRPHVYLDEEEKPSGSLVNYVNTLCKELDKGCSFSTGNFFSHLEKLQAGQINALLVTDSVLLPTVDEIIFTPPLCKISPTFIYKIRNDDSDFKSVDDIKNVTIGVHLDSSFHIYLLDEYYSHSRIKPYSLLESGVFDLANDRIDALFAEESFFEARVATTTLISNKKGSQLATLEVGKVELPFKTMSLALSARDTELYEQLSTVINAQGPTRNCVDLVRKKTTENTPEKPSSETSESVTPAQGNEAK